MRYHNSSEEFKQRFSSNPTDPSGGLVSVLLVAYQSQLKKDPHFLSATMSLR